MCICLLWGSCYCYYAIIDSIKLAIARVLVYLTGLSRWPISYRAIADAWGQICHSPTLNPPLKYYVCNGNKEPNHKTSHIPGHIPHLNTKEYFSSIWGILFSISAAVECFIFQFRVNFFISSICWIDGPPSCVFREASPASILLRTHICPLRSQ